LKNLVLLLIICISICAQQPTLEWAASYHNTYSEARSMSVDNLGNIFLCGDYYQTPQRSQYLTIKYNSSGIFQWSRHYRGPDTMVTGGVDIAYKCIADRVGNVYVAGSSYNNLNGEDVLIIKYDTKGDTIWTARYNGPGNGGDIYVDMVIDKYANIYIACNSLGGGVDYTAVKYDSSGNKLWTGYYPAGRPASIAIDSALNVYLTGNSLSGFFFQYTTVKFSNSGVFQWVKNYSEFNADAEAVSVAVDENKNVYVTGSVDSSTIQSLSKIFTIKYDSLGNVIWFQRYKSLFFWMDEAYKILLDASGNPLISGTGLIKYNSNGDFLWADTMAGGRIISLDKQNNIYIAGDTSINGIYNNPFKRNRFLKNALENLSIQTLMKTIKYNQNGNRIWGVTYGSIIPGGMSYGSSDIVVENNNNIYLAGGVTAGQNQDSIILLKYSQPIGIQGNGNQIPDKFKLYQNYPNPFNPKTIIKYSLPLPSKGGVQEVKLIISDILGKEVIILVNAEQKAGTYEVEWNAANFSSGVYFYTLKTVNFIATKKMILMK